jgi:hypothetical protein
MRHATSRLQAPALRHSLAVAMFAAGVSAPVPALAAFDIYLKIDNLTGDAAPGFVNTMQVVGYANGVKRSSFTPTCEPLAVTKTVDKATPALMKAAFVGTQFSKVELDLVRNGAIFLKYEMTAEVSIGVTEDSGEAGAAAHPAARSPSGAARLSAAGSSRGTAARVRSAACRRSLPWRRPRRCGPGP